MDYSAKDAAYFSEPRRDIVALLESGSRVLEIGCGAGATGALALEQGKAREYVGVEIEPAMADRARRVLTRVVEGNVETLDLSGLGSFDALVMSEVLEHLLDPWRTLRRLGEAVRPGGMLYCSSPNIASKPVIAGLIRGRFEYEESGIFDITHLRWFTPDSYARMVREAGFEVLSVEPLGRPHRLWRIFHALTGHRFRHLTMTQVFVVARKA